MAKVIRNEYFFFLDLALVEEELSEGGWKVFIGQWQREMALWG